VTYLVVDGEKMSKSKGNFYTLSDLLAKGHSAAAVRWLLLSAHYRTQLNFTLEGLKAAEGAVAYFRDLAASLVGVHDKHIQESFSSDAARSAFEEALDDDLNVSKALAVLHDFARDANRNLAEGRLGGPSADAARAFLAEALEKVFGVDLSVAPQAPEEVLKLAAERQAARADKDFAASDRLRDAIAEMGWIVEDTPQGQKLKKA
jgi:cysteinyl-tRNA synthetase